MTHKPFGPTSAPITAGIFRAADNARRARRTRAESSSGFVDMGDATDERSLNASLLGPLVAREIEVVDRDIDFGHR